MNHHHDGHFMNFPIYFTVLAAILTAEDKRRQAAINSEDVTLASTRHAVRLALEIMETNKGQN
jgi:hypothetical protein